VLDLAFVFHANILETQYLNCAGMVRVFFTRYHFKDSIFSPLNFHLHSPFSNVYAESYPSRIWHFVLEVKHVMEKLLNDLKQYQSYHKMATLKCSYECWHYFYYCMLNSNAIFLHFHRSHAEKYFHCDLSLSSISSKKELQLIRVDSEFSIRFARNLLAPHLE
jgi:hypothetical protein